MASEKWRPIPGYEGHYDVSDRGRVRSWRMHGSRNIPYVMSGHVAADGYTAVTLRHGGATKTRRVHALVLLAFVGPRPPGMQTRHLDGDKTHNALGNLAYGTPSENARDNVRLGVNPYTRRTYCNFGHAFDEANSYYDKRGHRRCRACWDRHREMRRARASHRPCEQCGTPTPNIRFCSAECYADSGRIGQAPVPVLDEAVGA